MFNRLVMVGAFAVGALLVGTGCGGTAQAQETNVTQEQSVGQSCGGFAGTPCPSGLVCVDDPSDSCDPNNGGRDCAGICQYQSCGGFAGTACPSGFTCVDDPRDTCNPATGGRDCIGICVP